MAAPRDRTSFMTSQWDLHPDGCTLAPATPAEETFLRALFVAVETAAMPLPLPALVGMLDLQYDARAAGYRQNFPNATDLIIRKDGTDIGRIMIDFSTRPIHVIDLAILPERQSRGIGTSVLRALCDAAGAQGTQVSLSVIEGQPAQRLYARLGFVVTGRTPPHVTMLWPGI